MAFEFEELESRLLLSAGASAAPVLTVHTTAALSQPRGVSMAVGVEDDAIFAGGNIDDAGDATTTIDIYDAADNRWSTWVLPFTNHPSEQAAIAVGDEAVFYVQESVETFNAATQQWQSNPNLVVGPNSIPMLAASVGNDAVFSDGETLLLYNVKGGQNTHSNLPLQVFGTAMTAADGQVVFAGGSAILSVGLTNAVQIYNVATGQWSSTTMPSARLGISAASVGNDMFFAGGNNGQGSGYSAEVDIYDAATGRWWVASLSQARSYMSILTVGNEVFFIGGQNSSGASNVIDIYNTTTGRWSAISCPYNGIASAVAAGGRLYLATNTVIEIYDVAAGQWGVVPLSVDRSGAVGVGIGDAALFAGGSIGFAGEESAAVDIVGSLPVLSGSIARGNRGSAAVTVTNGDTIAQPAPYYIALYASPSRDFSPTETQIAVEMVQRSLRPGGSVSLSIPFSIPRPLAGGNYHIFLAAGTRGDLEEVAALPGTVVVSDSSQYASSVSIPGMLAAESVAPMESSFASQSPQAQMPALDLSASQALLSETRKSSIF